MFSGLISFLWSLSSHAAKIFGGKLSQLLDVALFCYQQCGEGGVAAAGQLVAVGGWDFSDKAMTAEQAQLAGDPSGLPFRRGGIARRLAALQRAQVAVPEAVNRELAPCLGCHQSAVGGALGRQGADPAALPLRGLAGLQAQ